MTYKNEVKKQHKVVIRFWCGEFNEENEPLFAGERFTLSLHEQSALRPFLEAWRGKQFTEAELKGFDLEKLLKIPALIQVSHRASGERTYANITSIMQPPKGSEKIAPLADYVRAKDRKEEAPAENTQNSQSSQDDDDDSLPF